LADKLRIFQLAKDLNVDSKVIIDKCRAENVDVRNHMSTVSAGLAATIREWFSDIGGDTATQTAAPVDLKQVRRKRRAPSAAPAEAPSVPEAAVIEVAETEVPALIVEEPSAEPAILEPLEDEQPAEPVPVLAREDGHAAAAEVRPRPAEPPAPAPPEPKKPQLIAPAGPQHVPRPVQLRGPRVIRVEKPEALPPPRRPRLRQAGIPATPAAEAPPPPGSARGKVRSKTYQSSEEPAKAPRPGRRRGSDAGELIMEWKDSDLAERQERIRGATGRRARRRASEGRGAVEYRAITRAQVSEPIVLKEFCSATGLSLAQLSPKMLNDLKIIPNINMTLENETAILLASEFGIELIVAQARSPLDAIRDEFERREQPQLTHRAPVVTFLGHVDHGKTSLLDAIRQSRVAKGEAGGITQHIGAYHVERDGRSVTFLDTPGHEAFTAMRARGANLTDVVVLVVAADDGVMPQTREAINHARAAGVPIVVALNKIDVPGVDLNKIYGQLSEQQLAPAEWGGQTDVIKTSATQGIGIDDLLEHLSTLSELLEFKADPTLAAYGHVIEAEMKAGVGPVARVLIQDGSLRRGQFIVCGPGFGKVRSIKDDQGRDLEIAGPSMPVEVSGLDDLPSAGDELFQVESLRRAEDIAKQVKQQLRRSSLSTVSKPKTLEELFGQKQAGTIPELGVILKADMQGSVDVLRKTLTEIPSNEVRVDVLHSGVGAINESDVLLAEASGALVVGFQVVPEAKVQRLADEKGVDVRMYRVIYDLLDDIKQALEGLLEPEQKVERRGEAEVRDVFKYGKVGSVAGCYVRDGSFTRQYLVRVIRDGVVVRDAARLTSLRRYKDDVKEVKAGYECGMKIEGFDDVKPGDVLESYEIVKVARKLQVSS
jgi:translation initiation factor IF-2